MKKIISIFVPALLLLVAVTACSKQDNKGTANTGKLEVIFGFSTDRIDENAGLTKANYTQSTAKPTTSWTGNIKDLMILCVDGSNIVRAARNVNLTGTGANMNALPQIFQGIPAGTYTVYAIANSQQATITSSFTGGTGTWNEGTFIGKNINNALLTLIATTPAPTVGIPATGGPYTCYNVPAEIFVGSRASVNVPVNGTSTQASIDLTRAVGMMRVRIDHTTAAHNKDVVFTGANSILQIRRATHQWSLGTLIASSPRTATNVIYKSSAFSIAPTPSGYTGDMNLTGNITCWSDVIMFPGGSTTVGTDMFDILISGIAPLGYMPTDGPATTNATTPVYWAGQVKGAVIANNILELDCELRSAGSIIPPGIGEYGDLSVIITPKDWGSITSVHIPL